MPHLEGLSKRGSSGILLSEPPLLSPILWTTIAAGKPPVEHGVTSFVVDRKGPRGEPLPVQRTERRCEALWGILSRAGRSVSVIGWWATYPAEVVRGTLVSDFVGFHNFSMSGRGLASPVGKVYPPEIWRLVEEQFVASRRETEIELGRLASLSEAEMSAEGGADGGREAPSVLDQLRQMTVTSIAYARLARCLARPRRADFTAVYLNLTDWSGHLFGRFTPPPLATTSEEGRKRFGGTFEEAYVLADRLVGELLEEWGPESRVLVLSDHGFKTGSQRPREGDMVEVGHAHEWHRPEGILIAGGPGILGGKEIRGAGIYDIAPTVLHLLGLPAAEDMPGRVLLDILEPEDLAAHPVLRRIPTYETGSPVESSSPGADDGTDEEVIRNLRAMGYLGSSTDLPAAALVTRAEIEEREGSTREAIEDLERAVAAEPADPEIRVRLAQSFERVRAFDRARPQWEAAVRMSPENPSLRLELAKLLLLESQITGAVEHLRKAFELAPDSVPVRIVYGDALRRSGDLEGAERLFRSVTTSHPSEAIAWYNLGVCLARRGAATEAEEAY